MRSPAGSWRGWSLWKLLSLNKDKVKSVVSVLGGYLATVVAGIEDQALSACLGVIVASVFFIIGSAIDFYLSDVEVSKAA